jgi:hypothetical protein
MNLTLSINEKILRRARRAAATMGMSLNQAVRRFLEDLAGDDSVDKDIAEMNNLSAGSGGRSRGWRLDRDEIHERRP